MKALTLQSLSESVCYHLDKQLNCLIVGATFLGSFSHTMHVSFMSPASVRALVVGCQSNGYILIGLPSLMRG